MDKIRNFAIISHVDHGKSTLADRFLEITKTVKSREMREQLLDQMDLERERGITIKLQPVRMSYTLNATPYTLNLIDTPGHVDFSYEVSRSLAACEGALLVVDATQGVQAQTVANVYLAIEAGLEIIPVLNKIDLPAAEPERVSSEIVSLIGGKAEDILHVSAKTGENVEQILEAIVAKVPPPSGQLEKPLRALIFDSQYDEYRGVILYVRVVDGRLSKNQQIHLMGSVQDGQAIEVGKFTPKLVAEEALAGGQIGYIVTNLKSVEEARVGDTVTLKSQPAGDPLPGYKEVRPFVYAGLFPTSGEDYEELKEALERLKLNDGSLVYEPENSQVLGFGYRAGFLGLLHMEVVRERLEREYDLDLVVTTPSTEYQLTTTTGEEQAIRSANDLPDPIQITELREPWIKGEIATPKNYVGNVVQLINAVRGIQKNTSYVDENLALVEFEAPLSKVLTDFYDQLKSETRGYGSFNYELSDYRAADLVKLDILVAGEVVDSFSQIVHRDEAMKTGRQSVEKLKDVIPRQQFEISLQAAIGGKIVARENVKALGKNVTGHLYGGDVSRKKKLWAKQKKGKARMKKVGQVDIPPEAFTALLKKD